MARKLKAHRLKNKISIKSYSYIDFRLNAASADLRYADLDPNYEPAACYIVKSRGLMVISSRGHTDIINTVKSATAAEPAPGTPEQFGAFIRTEIDKWAKAVKAANMKVE